MEALPEILLEHVLLYCEAKARCLATAVCSALSRAVLVVNARRKVLALGSSSSDEENRHEDTQLLKACTMTDHFGWLTSDYQIGVVQRMWSRYNGLIQLRCEGVANDSLVDFLAKACNEPIPVASSFSPSKISFDRDGAAAAASSSSSSSSSLPVVEHLPWGHHFTPASSQRGIDSSPPTLQPPQVPQSSTSSSAQQPNRSGATPAVGGSRFLLPSLRVLSLAHSPMVSRQALCGLLCLRRSLDFSSAGRMFQRDQNEEFVAPRLLFQLETLDLTFCFRITYEATLLFRRALREAAETAAGATSSAVAAGNATDPASVQAEDSTATNGAGNLDIVRLPPWLTGSFITPFGGGGGGNTNADGGGAGSGSSTSNSSSRRNRPEEHTYYCDGSFSFGRGSQANGYVMRLEEHASYTSHLTSSGAAADGASRTTLDPRLAEGAEMGEVRDTLQYVDFEPPPDWPSWTKYMYRPGVALRDLGVPEEDEEEEEDGSGGGMKGLRSVLVAQALSGLRAPNFGFPQLLTEEVDIDDSKQHNDLDGALSHMIEASAETDEPPKSSGSSNGKYGKAMCGGSNSSSSVSSISSSSSSDDQKRRQQRLKHLRSEARRMIPLGTSMYLLPSGVLLPRYQPLPEEEGAEAGVETPLPSPSANATTTATAAASASATSISNASTSSRDSSRRRVPWTAESAAAAGAVGMVSRMQVRPLSRKHRMPPRQLEDRIMAFMSEMNEMPFTAPGMAYQLETSLHLALGGSLTDAGANMNHGGGDNGLEND